MSVHNSKVHIRITVLGGKVTGKTTLVRNYVMKSKTTDDLQSPDAAYTCNEVIENTDVTQQILVSDGKNGAVTAWAHGVIVVYAVDDRDSWLEAEKIVRKTKQVTMKNATIMLVANKVDITNRTVSLVEGQKLASENNCNYKELSATNDRSTINSVFYELSHEIIEKRGLKLKFYQQTPTMVRKLFQALTKTREKRSYTSYM